VYFDMNCSMIFLISYIEMVVYIISIIIKGAVFDVCPCPTSLYYFHFLISIDVYNK
jgi:hypothetical protein